MRFFLGEEEAIYQIGSDLTSLPWGRCFGESTAR